MDDRVFFGTYTVSLRDDIDACLIIDVTMDENGNVLILKGAPFTTDGVDGYQEITTSLSDAYALKSPSGSSRPSGSSARSNGSSYTPARREQNALNRAKDYLEFMSFSHGDLINQLEFEGFVYSQTSASTTDTPTPGSIWAAMHTTASWVLHSWQAKFLGQSP